MTVRRALGVAVLMLPLLACGSEAVVTPDPVAPTPAPTPVPTPEPTPVPTPAPPPADSRFSTAPVAGVTAGVHSYRRNGKLIQGSAQSYRPGDVVYLNCTPRDEEGKPTTSHGPIQGWNLTGESSINGCWRATDTGTFNPDVHLGENCGEGQITCWCTVDGFRSNGYKLRVRP